MTAIAAVAECQSTAECGAYLARGISSQTARYRHGNEHGMRSTEKKIARTRPLNTEFDWQRGRRGINRMDREKESVAGRGEGVEVMPITVEQAFLAYVNSQREDSDPKILGLCCNCHFPVFRSQDGASLYHYAYGTAKRFTCGYPALPNEAKERSEG